jgi:hypothetical protein
LSPSEGGNGNGFARHASFNERVGDGLRASDAEPLV